MTVFFLLLAIVITSVFLLKERNSFKNLIWFLIILIQVAIVFLDVENTFFFASQVIIYVGSILILLIILFLTQTGIKDIVVKNIYDKDKPVDVILIFLTLFAVLVIIMLIGLPSYIRISSRPVPKIYLFSLEKFGEILIKDYYILFELISLILFFVLIVSVYLLKRNKNE